MTIKIVTEGIRTHKIEGLTDYHLGFLTALVGTSFEAPGGLYELLSTACEQHDIHHHHSDYPEEIRR